MRAQGTSKKALTNEAITAPKLRLVSKDGVQLGIVDREEALSAASKEALDLVLIADQVDPPVAKIMNYGKHVFEQKKARSAARKKQKQIQVKEIKLRPSTSDGDYQIKVRNLIRFLNDGNKAKVTLRFKGREIIHRDLGVNMMERVGKDLSDHGVMESEPKFEGRQMFMVFAPHSKKGKSR